MPSMAIALETPDGEPAEMSRRHGGTGMRRRAYAEKASRSATDGVHRRQQESLTEAGCDIV